MQYSFLAVEGNIGAGKSTLARMLADHYRCRLIAEGFADNPFLPLFYKDPKQYGFPLEVSFLAERYKQLHEVLHTNDLFKKGFVSDYIFTKSLLFAKVTLADEEFRLFQRLFDIINPRLQQPDLMIYLHAPISRLQVHIRTRARKYEQEISNDYLFRIQETYLEYIRQHPIRTLIVDMSDADFEHESGQFEVIVGALERDYPVGHHYLRIT